MSRNAEVELDSGLNGSRAVVNRISDTTHCAVNALLDLAELHPSAVKDIDGLWHLLELDSQAYHTYDQARALICQFVLNYTKIKSLDMLAESPGCYLLHGNQHWFLLNSSKIKFGAEWINFSKECIWAHGWHFEHAFKINIRSSLKRKRHGQKRKRTKSTSTM